MIASPSSNLKNEFLPEPGARKPALAGRQPRNEVWQAALVDARPEKRGEEPKTGAGCPDAQEGEADPKPASIQPAMEATALLSFCTLPFHDSTGQKNAEGNGDLLAAAKGMSLGPAGQKEALQEAAMGQCAEGNDTSHRASPISRHGDPGLGEDATTHSGADQHEIFASAPDRTSGGSEAREEPRGPAPVSARSLLAAPSDICAPAITPATPPSASASPSPMSQVLPALRGTTVQMSELAANGTGTGMTSLTLRLHPEDLGEVTVTLRLRRGHLSVSLAAERTETAAMLRQEQRLLDQAMSHLVGDGPTPLVTIDSRDSPHDPGQAALQGRDMTNTDQPGRQAGGQHSSREARRPAAPADRTGDFPHAPAHSHRLVVPGTLVV